MKKKIVIMTCIIVIAIVSIVRIIMLNVTAASYKLEKEYYDMGEQVTLNDFLYKVDNYSILNASDMKTKYDFSDDSIKDDKIFYAIVNIDCTYVGEEASASPEILDMSLMSGVWNNGINLNATIQLNEKDLSLATNQTSTYKVVFNLRKDTFSNSAWKGVCTREYHLVMMKYPRAIIMDL